MKVSRINSPRSFSVKAVLVNIGLSAIIAATTYISSAHAAVGEPEKEELKFGFIKLTDMAPLAIAYEKGYFEDEGLYVTLEAQANWKVLLVGSSMVSLMGRTCWPGNRWVQRSVLVHRITSLLPSAWI